MVEFRYTLFDGTNTEVLTVPPRIAGQGSDEIAGPSITLRRDERYHGVFQNFTIDLEFLCIAGGGFDFINDLYETNGPSQLILVYIDYKCGGNAYSRIMTGKIDLTQMVRTESYIGCRVDNYDIGKKVLDRADIPINMEAATGVEGNTLTSMTFGGYNINMHSRSLFQESSIGFESTTTHSTTNSLTNSINYGGWFQPPFSLLNNAIKETTSQTEINDVRSGGPFAFPSSNILKFFTLDDPLLGAQETVSASWSFIGEFSDTISTAQTRIMANGIILYLIWGQTLSSASFASLGTIGGYSTSANPYTDTFSITSSANITLNQGDSIWLAWGIDTAASGYVITTGAGVYDVTWAWEYTTASFDFEITSTTDPTTAEGWAIHEAWAQICESLANQTASTAFYSDLYGRLNSNITYGINGCQCYLAITSGKKIRQFTDNSVFVKLSDLFDACNSLNPIGLGVENNSGTYRIRVEDIEHFYDVTDIMLTCNNVDNIEMRIDSSKYWNGVDVGFEKWEVDEIGGLDEVNTKAEYVIPSVERKNQYSIVSPYIMGSYAIEIARRLEARKQGNTKDYKYDNDIFILALNQTVNGSDIPTNLDDCEQDENFATISGILGETTIYNLRYTPVRNLLRHVKVLNGGMYRATSKLIRWQSKEGNKVSLTEMTADGCPGDYEGAAITDATNISTAVASSVRDVGPIWIPELYTFEYPVSLDDFIAIMNDPTGVIRFSPTTSDYKKGFIIGMEYNLLTGRAEFELLRAYES